MRSVRLDPELEQRIERAAALRGESLSEFIRRAAADRADATLKADPVDDFADVLGVVHGGGGRARKPSEAFRRELAQARRRR